jgi:acyl dehydratase
LSDVPNRKPDHKFSGETYPSQALLYRLSGDTNPLHVDPSVAAGQNFEKPILHGLATYGLIAKVLVQNLLRNEPSRLKSIRGRFLGHVYPGELLDISVWKQDENVYIF